MEHKTYTAEEEQYIVHNPKEVMQIITDLMKLKTSLRASFNHGEDVYLTNVIAVDTKSHAVHLDIGRDEDFNRRLLASERVIFSKDDGVKVKWSSGHISEVVLRDGKAIRISLPQDLVRLQRREYFRFSTPIVNPVPCKIALLKPENAEDERTLDLNLCDVSLGGIGVLVLNSVDIGLVIGQNYQHCKISFTDVGVTDLTLQVRHITQLPTKDGIVKYHIGLQYIEPSRGNEGLINRYVFMLERQAIALVNGPS